MNGQKVHPLGFAVGEVYSSDPKWLLADAFEGGALNGAFNFPMRKKLTQVFATYDNNFEKGTCGAPASDLETAGYAGMRIYPETAMPVNFISNHDFLRFGDLLQRARYTNDGEKNFEYFARHRAVWSFLASMSGPLSILYGDESADELPGLSISRAAATKSTAATIMWRGLTAGSRASPMTRSPSGTISCR